MNKKVVLDRLASFNLSHEQKNELIEVIKYVARYGVHTSEDEINRLVAFLKKYEINEDGTFPDFAEYISKFDTLDEELKIYIETHKKELESYVRNSELDEKIAQITSTIQSQINGLKHIPEGGREGQFIVADNHGNPIWVDHSCIPSEDNQTYGIEWEKGSNTCTRIGNMELHRTRPIQSKLKGCLHDGKHILHWLNPDGWGLPMDNGQIPVLDGSMGDVGVALTTEYFVKVVVFETKYQIWISEKNMDGTWIRISPCIYSANKTLTRINSAGLEEAFNACISPDDTTHVGGNKSTTYTSKLHGRPRTGITCAQAHTFCKNRGNGIKVIDYLHYCGLQLLYYIEFANFDSQAAVNKTLTSGGFRQGGLGAGVTNINYNKWNTYNGCNPIIPTYFQVDAQVGNRNYCDTPYTLGTDYTGDTTTFNTTPAYFHGIHLFGDIWSFIGDVIVITDNDDTTISIVYKLKDGVNYTDVTVENIKEKCFVIGYQTNASGWIQEFDLSSGPYFIPTSTASNKKYDYQYANSNLNQLRVLLVGGAADSGGIAGVGYFNSLHALSSAGAYVGFFTITELD